MNNKFPLLLRCNKFFCCRAVLISCRFRFQKNAANDKDTDEGCLNLSHTKQLHMLPCALTDNTRAVVFNRQQESSWAALDRM